MVPPSQNDSMYGESTMNLMSPLGTKDRSGTTISQPQIRIPSTTIFL